MGSAHGALPVMLMRSRERALFQTERPVFTLAGPQPMTADGDRQSRELTNQVLMQIRDSLDLIRRKQDSFGEDLHAISERTARLEERNTRLDRVEKEQERIGGQIELLVADKHKRDGAISLASWFSQHYPFVAVSAALAGIIAWANGLFGKGAP
jgi:hypothetical protein